MKSTDSDQLVLDEAFGADFEWWHAENGETYKQLARQLIQHGYTIRQAADFLGAAYGAASDEYGG